MFYQVCEIFHSGWFQYVTFFGDTVYRNASIRFRGLPQSGVGVGAELYEMPPSQALAGTSCAFSPDLV